MGALNKKYFIMQLKKLSKKNKSKEIQGIIGKYNGIEYAEAKMNEYIEKSIGHIKTFPNNKHIVEFVDNIFYEKA